MKRFSLPLILLGVVFLLTFVYPILWRGLWLGAGGCLGWYANEAKHWWKARQNRPRIG